MTVILWNARARNSQVEATLNHPFAAQARSSGSDDARVARICGSDARRALRSRNKKKHEKKSLFEDPSRIAKGEGSLACAHALWRTAFNNLGSHVACGGILYVADLLGAVYDSGKLRCWSEYGADWAKKKGYETVEEIPGAPCTQHFPALHVKKVCPPK